jgi:hypothetical protein
LINLTIKGEIVYKVSAPLGNSLGSPQVAVAAYFEGSNPSVEGTLDCVTYCRGSGEVPAKEAMWLKFKSQPS